MRNYMYLILVTFKLSIFKILKNSFIFAFLGIKRNLAALLGTVIVCFINVYLFVWLPLVGLTLPLIITTTTVFFIGAYAAYPVIKKYMITPYYKDEEDIRGIQTRFLRSRLTKKQPYKRLFRVSVLLLNPRPARILRNQFSLFAVRRVLRRRIMDCCWPHPQASAD